MTVGKRLAQLRKERKMSQYELAERMKMTRGQIGNYELGTRNPDIETLRKIAEFFDVSIDYLAGKTDDPRPMNPAVREIVENQDPKDLQLTPAEVRRLTELLEDPELHVAFRKGVLAKKVNPRRLLKTLELLAMDDDEWDKE